MMITRFTAVLIPLHRNNAVLQYMQKREDFMH